MSAPHAVPDATAPSERWFAAAVTVIALVASALRVWQATRSELWFDEIYSLWVARLDWPAMLRVVANDVHPPLHFTIIKLWRTIGGESSLWIKLSSVLPGVALVVASATLGRSLFGARTGLLAASLLAVHGTHVMVSQDARAFAWLSLWVWLAAWLALRWIRDGRPGDAVGVLLAETLGLYTHYLSGAVFASLFLWGVVVLARERPRLAHWIGIHLAVTASFAPQLGTFLYQTHRDTGAHWSHHASWESLFSLARHAAFGSTVLLVPFALLMVLPLARERQRRAASLIVTLMVSVTVLTFVLTRLGGHVYTERYMFWVVPGCCLLAAAGLADLRQRWLAVGLTLAFVVQGMRVIAGPPPAEPRRLAETQHWLELHASPADAIVCADTHSLYYLRQHALRLPGAVLLWPETGRSSYEGTELIPPGWIHGDAALDSLAAAHVRWWAVRTLHGGASSAPAAALIERAGGRLVMRAGETSVYAGSEAETPAPAR